MLHPTSLSRAVARPWYLQNLARFGSCLQLGLGAPLKPSCFSPLLHFYWLLMWPTA